MNATKGPRCLDRVVGQQLRAAMVLAVVGGLCFGAQEQPTIQVGVTSPRTDLLLCEPLVLDVHVKNVGQSDATLREMRAGEYGYSVHVRLPRGQTLSYQDVFEGSRMKERTIGLSPGEVHRHREVIVCFSCLSYVIGDAGYYSVQVSCSADGRPESTVQAAPLHVKVREPQGLEAEAFELFEGRRQAYFMAGWTGERSTPEMERLAMGYPQTVYGRYARFYLAKALISPNRARDQTRYAKAAALFEGLIAEESGFPLTDQCMLDLADCYEQTNRAGEARTVLEKLLEGFPESPVATPAKKKLDSLQPPTPTPQVPQPADTKPELQPQPKPDQPPGPAE